MLSWKPAQGQVRGGRKHLRKTALTKAFRDLVQNVSLETPFLKWEGAGKQTNNYSTQESNGEIA